MATTYQIKKGDTLSKIARANNTTVSDIIAQNKNITDPNKIAAGASLTIGASPTTKVQTTTAGMPVAPSSKPSPATNVIPLDKTAPVTPVALPPKTTDSSIAAANATISKTGTMATPPVEAVPKTAKDIAQLSYEQILQTMTDIGNAQNVEDTAFTEAGGDTVKENYDRITSELEKEQAALARRKQEVLGSGAMTREQAAAQIEELNRQSANYQADLAIQQSATVRDYTRISELAKTKSDLILKPLQAKLETLKFVYDANKDIMTKEEDRAFQLKIRAEDQAIRKAERDEDYKREVAMTGLRNGMSVRQATGIMNGTMSAASIAAQNLPKGSSGNGLVNRMLASAGKGSPIATERKSFSKLLMTADQLSNLSELSKGDIKKGFFGGRISNAFAKIGSAPNAAAFQAQITALVPGLARGVYGEVGVLTDTDTAVYKSTLPSLTNTEQQNKALLAVTLLSVKSGMEAELKAMSGGQIDVSGYVQDYKDISLKILKIEDDIGVSGKRLAEMVKLNPELAPVVAEAKQKGYKPSDVLFELGAY